MLYIDHKRGLSILLITLFLVELLLPASQVLAVEGDTIEMSPGKILPEGYNHYLRTSEVQVQLEFPRAYILQETEGDFLFNVTLTSPRRTIAIYIPPEFELEINSSRVWASITNDYRFISLAVLGERDPIAPNWYRITISNGTSRISSGSHYIRVFNVTAPSIVGRYFFKVFTDGSSIGAENFPTLVVSADPNPAYITGRVLDGSTNATLYGKPIQLHGSDGGKVIAEGITPEGRIVVAQAFFNASANGGYTLYGLAPGSYELTASAAGYSPTTKPERVEILAGQSLVVDLYVYPAPKIEGIVWSKCEFGPTKWSPIATRVGPQSGAALAYVGTSLFPGKDLIYAIRGGGTADLLRYDAFTDKWEMQRSTPSAVGPGGAMAFDGLRYIYAFQGGESDAFWRYDVVDNAWSILREVPANVGPGGALVFNSNDGFLYGLRGSGTTDFWRYDPIANSWATLTPTPASVDDGGALVFNSNDGRIYALRGGSSTDFWRYDPSSNSWEPRASAPAIGSGGALTFASNNGKIYAFRGGTTQEFWEYDPTGDTWMPRANLIESVGGGGALTFNINNGYIFAFVGGASPSFWRYDPIGDSWTKVQDILTKLSRPITIEILDSIDTSKRLIQGFTDPNSEKFVFNYDGSIDLDGHIPQDNAGYVSGIEPYISSIEPGRFQVKAWVNGYIQTEEVWVQLLDCEAKIRVQFDLHRVGSVEVVVYFKDSRGAASPVPSTSTLSVSLYDQNDVLRGENSTRVAQGATDGKVVITGFIGTLRDYGLPQGTYTVEATMSGYYQPNDVLITLSGGCSSHLNMSLLMLRTGTLKITVRSVNWQTPPKLLDWAYPGSPLRIEIRDEYGLDIVATHITQQRFASSTVTANITGLRSDMYSIFIFTPGYYQPSPYRIPVFDGATTDLAVNVIKGGVIELELQFMKEGMFSTIDTYPFAPLAPLRVEIYDELELQFVGANITHIPCDRTTFTIRLIGFKTYAGNPALRWVNYYDTTDSSLQRDYGLSKGRYSLKVYLPGYEQPLTTITNLPAGGEASVVLKLERLGHLFGNVYGLNMYDEAIPLSWVTVDARSPELLIWTPTLDGYFEMWLQRGSYLVVFTLPGYEAISKEVFVGDGAETSLNIFYMEPLSYAIPEFPLNFRFQSLCLLFIAKLIDIALFRLIKARVRR
ncbi:MAG: carboxypeptidase regulatory-like domain-containing protein [Candidatus Bathyarchaeia archaeon]